MDIEVLLVRCGIGGTVFVQCALLAAWFAAVRPVASASHRSGDLP